MKEKEYNAIVKIFDKEALTHCANEYYEGDLHAAVNGELAWVEQSGLEVELVDPLEDIDSKDLELTEEMIKRNDEIDHAVWNCICILTEKEPDWNMEIIGRVTDAIKDILAEYGLKVRHPAIEIDEGGNQRYVEYD